MKPRAVAAALALSCALGGAPGCGGSSVRQGVTPPAADAAAPTGDGSSAPQETGADPAVSPRDAAPLDAAASDLGTTEVAPRPAAVLPQGKQLLASSDNVWLRGVTSDGLAIYLDPLFNDVVALPLDGRPAALITKVPGQFAPNVNVVGRAVAIATTTTQDETAVIWTAAHGGALLSTNGDNNVAVSRDGQYVMFVDGVGTEDVSLFAARTDGTARARLAFVSFPNPFDPNACPAFEMGFVGHHAFATFCEPKPANVPHRLQATAWGGPAWTRALHVPEDADVYPAFTANPRETDVLLNTKSGLQIHPVAGGAATTVDPAGFLGAFSHDGKAVIYTTTARQMRRADITSPLTSSAPVTLLNDGAETLLKISPDDRLALVAATAPDKTVSLRLASTSTPGAPLFHATGPVIHRHALFTADSKYVVYWGAEKTTTANQAPSRLYAIPSTGVGTPMLLTAGALSSVRASTGSKL
ncbi:MAG TPA: hypothetical protein VGG33_21845, partial [Polyangia bacterium]